MRLQAGGPLACSLTAEPSRLLGSHLEQFLKPRALQLSDLRALRAPQLLGSSSVTP